MATTKCSQCGEKVSTTDPVCPHCGAPADKIRKAAAGLEALVALGDVVHERGTIVASGVDVETLGRKFLKDRPDQDFLFHSARAGDTNAMMLIGHIYMDGKRVRKDMDQAEKWWRLALKHGDRSASETLDLLERIRSK